ncbi:hypothetical protein DDZ15_01480 [Rhodohalobacter mucosus]|uniref:Uncharacterized protein n=1 Tax=Rhodohalobacter mucosus TaxID=2079485 RepID=A0A316TTG5_9BACT|nr:hypothetical protein DDZ15_01480 [Rhodohalobacter mucosus]
MKYELVKNCSLVGRRMAGRLPPPPVSRFPLFPQGYLRGKWDIFSSSTYFEPVIFYDLIRNDTEMVFF